MEIRNPLWIKTEPYLKASPVILRYQFVSKAVIAIWVFLLRWLFQVLLKSTGRVAVTSGDYLFLVTTWQGLLIMILGFVSLFLYVSVDINAKVMLSKELITDQKVSIAECLKEALYSVRRLVNIRGSLVVLYSGFRCFDIPDRRIVYSSFYCGSY